MIDFSKLSEGELVHRLEQVQAVLSVVAQDRLTQIEKNEHIESKAWLDGGLWSTCFALDLIQGAATNSNYEAVTKKTGPAACVPPLFV